MRKGISSLYGLMSEKMKSEVRNGDVFILVGSSRKLMKLRHAGGRQAVELIQVNQSETRRAKDDTRSTPSHSGSCSI